MSELNIYQRLAEVMKDVDYVRKEDKKVNNQYTFVSHDTVTALVRQSFIKYGVISIPTVTAHSQDGHRTEVDMSIDFVNIDKPDDRVTISSFGYGIDQQDKGPGKAISYAVKYGYLKALALETGDDPERDMINYAPAPKPQKKADPIVIPERKCTKDEIETLETSAKNPVFTEDERDKVKEFVLEAHKPLAIEVTIDRMKQMIINRNKQIGA